MSFSFNFDDDDAAATVAGGTPTAPKQEEPIESANAAPFEEVLVSAARVSLS